MKRIHLWIYSMAILVMADVLFANPIITLNQRLLQTEAALNTQSVALGDAQVASRISEAVSVDASTLTAQRNRLDTDWGTLLIAHQMAPLSRDRLTVQDAVRLHEQGMSWNQMMTRYRISPARLSRALQTDLGTLGLAPVGGSSGRQSGSPTIVNGGTSDGDGVTGGNVDREGANGEDCRTTDGNRNGSADLDHDRSTRERSTAASNGRAVGIERSLEASVDRLESDADRRGDGAAADRLAAELRVSSDLLHEQRDRFDASWGDLLIAHTLVDQSRSGASVSRVFAMRDDGMSWFQIAKSLRVPPGRLMNLVRRGTSDVIGTTTAGTVRGAASKRIGAGKGSALRSSATANGRAMKTGTTSGATKIQGTARMGGSATKMGGGSVSTMRPMTRMGGGIGGGSVTRVHGAAGRGHGKR
ncbi:MAG TPA: hypothetical protein VFP58_14065 [Candidatus Eisenbacteria bacterium]|nr:hypothetical protein [Candidatus Eisenbacteria bacterium]